MTQLLFSLQEAVAEATGTAAESVAEAVNEPNFIVAAWTSLKGAFVAGGFFMWPILVISIFAIALIIERSYVLFFTANVNKDDFLKNLQKLIFHGNLNNAIIYASGRTAPLTNIIKSGLVAAQKGTETDVQIAIDEVSLKELPRIEKRTGYLAMIGNVAVLMGLLGTIGGLITSFGGVKSVDVSERAAKLAAGISEALHCTAFGLIVAILALLAYSILQGKSQTLLDDINESSVSVLNFITANKEKFSSGGKSSHATPSS